MKKSDGNRSARIKWLQLSALILLLVLTACSSGDPVSQVGPGGGTIRANGVTVVIPAGALDAVHTFNISRATGFPADHNIIGIPFTFSPDIVFLKPVTITMPYDLPAGVLQTNATLAAMEAGAWSPIPNSVVDLDHKTVSADVLHFSTYTPFWYEAPVGALDGYYFSAFLGNNPGSNSAGVNNTLYSHDGKTGLFGPEGTDTGTWTSFSYTMRADGLLRSNYVMPDGSPVKEFGIANTASKVHMYFQPSLVSSSSLVLFVFEKPDAGYLPSLAGSSYFVGACQSSLSDSSYDILAHHIDFETATTGHLTEKNGNVSPFTYVVEGGGKITMTVAFPSGTRAINGHLNPDASLFTNGYQSPVMNIAGLAAGARLSSGRTNADLSGAYHTVLCQPGESDKRVLYRTMTFDGKGAGTYVTYDEKLESPASTGTFTYSVNSDGTFTLNMAGLSEGYDELSILSPDGNIFVTPDYYGTHQTFTIGVKKQ